MANRDAKRETFLKATEARRGTVTRAEIKQAQRELNEKWREKTNFTIGMDFIDGTTIRSGEPAPKIGVNWSALGTKDADTAETFGYWLIEASRDATDFNRKYAGRIMD